MRKLEEWERFLVGRRQRLRLYERENFFLVWQLEQKKGISLRQQVSWSVYEPSRIPRTTISISSSATALTTTTLPFCNPKSCSKIAFSPPSLIASKLSECTFSLSIPPFDFSTTQSLKFELRYPNVASLAKGVSPTGTS